MREIKFRFWVDGANGEFMIYPDNRENSSFNSEGWKFYLNSKERALELAFDFGGLYVAKANWDEETLTTSYSELERVE